MEKEIKWQPQFEAIKLLKEWSTALVVIQSGALAIIGNILKNGDTVNHLNWIFVSMVSFLASILVAVNVIGAIPPIVQRLPKLVESCDDIYKMKNYLGIPLWILAFFQHILFFSGILCFVWFIYLNA
ncbi:MAG: hypothetical protein M0P73_15570 [Syntrophobacterales bacterium]|jgi:hypothetical protein|nr:hypothetical protein [Syntrophobacterales bacterium]